MKLSDKIVKLRKANGWSQEDFAEKLNVSRQAISRWENGTALPDAQNILQIGKLLGVTADYLLCDDREDFGENPIDQQTQQEEKNFVFKKRRRHLVSAIAFAIAAICWLIAAATGQSAVYQAFSVVLLVLCIGLVGAQLVMFFRK